MKSVIQILPVAATICFLFSACSHTPPVTWRCIEAGVELRNVSDKDVFCGPHGCGIEFRPGIVAGRCVPED